MNLLSKLVTWWKDKTAHQKRIEQFMRKGEQDLPNIPGTPPPDVRLLRARLVLEEAFELVHELGVDVRTVVEQVPRELDREFVDHAFIHTTFDRFKLDVRPLSQFRPNIECIAKETADLSVVTIGTFAACGIKDKPILEAVDRNNLEKFGPGGYRDITGKWIKPPGHKKPDIRSLLEDQGLAPFVS